MLIFHAIENPEIIPEFYEKTNIKLNILISYAFQKGNISKLVDTYRDKINLLYLDSGAYSVFTGKTKISLYEYTIFLKKYGKRFDECFTLDDKFDDADHNLLNQRELEEKLSGQGLKPVPVIHDFDDPHKEFGLYVELGHTFIALGSMGARKKIPNITISKIIEDFPDIKIHLFGTLNFNKLKKFKPYSADSSQWIKQATKGGSINYWRSSENKFKNFSVGGVESETRKHKHIKKSEFYDEMMAFFNEKFGYTYEMILNDANVRSILNLYSLVQVEEYINTLTESPPTENTKKNKTARKKKSK
jgi:hypothetical protein